MPWERVLQLACVVVQCPVAVAGRSAPSPAALGTWWAPGRAQLEEKGQHSALVLQAAHGAGTARGWAHLPGTRSPWSHGGSDSGQSGHCTECCRKSLCIWLKRGSQHLACLYLMTSASGFHTAGEEQPQHNRSHLELRLALGPQLYIIQTKWVLLGLLTAAGGVDSTPPPSHTTPDLLHLRPPIFPCAASNAVLLSCDLMCGCPQRTPGK